MIIGDYFDMVMVIVNKLNLVVNVKVIIGFEIDVMDD